MSTTCWPSTEVVNISRAFVGIVVLRGMSTLTIPPSVSIPRDSGVTSSSSMLVMPPARICACTAAPRATTSSGFSWLCGVLPNSSCTRRRTSGTRVEPPTRTTSSMSDGARPASASAIRHGVKRGVDQPLDELLELGPRDLAVVREAVEGNRERCPLVGRQADLGGLGGEPKLLHGLQVRR